MHQRTNYMKFSEIYELALLIWKYKSSKPKKKNSLRFFIIFKQKTAYEITTRLVGSEMCIRDRHRSAHDRKKRFMARLFHAPTN